MHGLEIYSAETCACHVVELTVLLNKPGFFLAVISTCRVILNIKYYKLQSAIELFGKSVFDSISKLEYLHIPTFKVKLDWFDYTI